LGWDVLLIAQDAEMIDKQVRALAEYQVHLRNLKRARWPIIGLPLTPGVNLFVALWTWHGTHAAVVKREVFPLSWPKQLYDTAQTMHGLDGADPDAIWLPRPARPDADASAAAAAEQTAGTAAAPASTPSETARQVRGDVRADWFPDRVRRRDTAPPEDREHARSHPNHAVTPSTTNGGAATAARHSIATGARHAAPRPLTSAVDPSNSGRPGVRIPAVTDDQRETARDARPPG
jgi:hypothetical protein